MVMQKEIIPVSSYESDGDAVDSLLNYPGNRPQDSYFTDGQDVEILPDSYTEFYDYTDQLLRRKGLPGMDERIPVLAYGKNAAPHFLAEKMAKYDVDTDVQSELHAVPHCKATVKDSMAAWHGRPGQSGSVFAELVKLPSTEGVDMHAHVAFLTTEQLAIISVTEGVTYSLAEVEALLGDDKVPMKVLAYVALDSTIHEKDGAPVAVRQISHTSDKEITSADPTEIVGTMLHDADYPIVEPRDYVAASIGMTLQEKKERQAAVGTGLDAAGSRQYYEYPAKEGELVGRVDFQSAISLSGLHDTIHSLPEQELSRLRPTEKTLAAKDQQLRKKYPDLSDEELRAKSQSLIDPARALSRRAHDELAARLRKEIDK